MFKQRPDLVLQSYLDHAFVTVVKIQVKYVYQARIKPDILPNLSANPNSTKNIRPDLQLRSAEHILKKRSNILRSFDKYNAARHSLIGHWTESFSNYT